MNNCARWILPLMVFTWGCDDPQPGDDLPPIPVPAKDASQDVPADAPADDAHDLPTILDPDTFNTVEQAYEAVNPFVGTGGRIYGGAALTPAAQAPLGLVKLGPDTSLGRSHFPQLHFSGYNHIDRDIRGFSHTHFVGTGVPDYGNLRVVLARPDDDVRDVGHHVPFEKSTERAHPGYYSVEVTEPNVQVELTATPHAGAHRYSFKGTDPVVVAWDAASSVTDTGVEQAHVEVDGTSFKGWVRYKGPYVGRRNPVTFYFDGQLLAEPASQQVWGDEQGLLDASITQATGTTAGISWTFDPSQTPTLQMRVGLSVVDAAQAQAHRLSQVPTAQTFEQILATTRALWERKLERVKVAGGTPQERRVLFTALYNSYRMPTQWSGEDGRYIGLDNKEHTAQGFTYYTDLSLWDTFRTLHPLYELIDPEVQADVLNSLLAGFDATGVVARWPAANSHTGGMIGTSADLLFGGSAAKGLPGVDWQRALDALLVTADNASPVEGLPDRAGVASYIELGHVPLEEGVNEAVSRSLEYYYNDWALANLADVANRPDVAARMRARAQRVETLWDPSTSFFWGRTREGQWAPGFDPLQYSDRGGEFYTEGNAWHWRFYIPWAPERFADWLGAGFADELETFFASSQLSRARPKTDFPDKYYWHGNEPMLHAAYLFHAAGRPERMAFWVDQIRSKLYGDRVDGLAGNDDGGTLSAWLVFSSLGLFPQAGGSAYWWGTPAFTRAQLAVAGGQTLTIEAPDAGPENRLPTRVTLGDEPVTQSLIEHDALLGNTLRFEMAPLQDP